MESPLESSRLRRILAAYTVNRLGTWIGLIALMLAVFDETGSAVAVAALLLAGQALPAFVVPAVVARVEASTRGRELSGLYVFEALVTAMLAVLLWHFWLPGVLVLSALDGTAALAASALLRAEVARAAREHAQSCTEGAGRSGENLEHEAQEAERRANAAMNVAFSVTFVLGPVIGGAIVAAAGASTALFLDSGSFLICGVLLIDLRPHVQIAGEASVRARLRAAWKHINQEQSLRRLLLVDALALIFFESAAPIEVTYAKATLHASDGGFGLLLTSWGLGAVLGSVVFARSLRRPLGMLLSAGVFAIGIAYLGFAASPSLALACGAALVGGIGNGVELPSLISLVQRLTPHALHGRLMGAVESLNSLCVAVGLALGGALVAVSSARAAFLVIGLGIMVTAVALYVVSRAAGGTAVAIGDRAPALEGAIATVQALVPVERAEATPGNAAQAEAPTASGAAEAP